MSSEAPPTLLPTDLAATVDAMSQEVDRLRRELTQAQEVWQATLAAEKNHFDELLQHKEMAWREQEAEWARQTQAYEQRLTQLNTEFEARLKQSEQHTAHALAELDDAWQHDKLSWGRPAPLLAPAPEPVAPPPAPTAIAEPSPARVRALEDQLHVFQETVASFQNRVAHSDELVNACVQALDYQISVLCDLLHTEKPAETPSNGGPIPLVEG